MLSTLSLSTPPANEPARGAATLVALLVLAFIDTMGSTMVVALLPTQAHALGAGNTALGALVATFAVAQLASAPAWGRLSDRIGRRPALLAGLAISAAAYAVLAHGTTLAALVASRVLQGVGAGTVGVLHAYAADVTPTRFRTRGFGRLTAATSLGGVAGPAIVALSEHVGSARAPGLAAAALCAAALLIAWYVLPAQFVAHNTGALGVGAVPRGARGRATGPHGVAARVIVVYSIAVGAAYAASTLLPAVLRGPLGAGAVDGAWCLMYLGAVGVVVRSSVLGPLEKRYSEVRLTCAGIAGIAASLALLAVAASYATLMCALSLLAVGMALTFPPLSALLSRLAPLGRRGYYMSLQHTASALGRAAFPLATGVALDATSTGAPFAAIAVLLLALVPVAAGLGRGGG